MKYKKEILNQIYFYLFYLENKLINRKYQMKKIIMIILRIKILEVILLYLVWLMIFIKMIFLIKIIWMILNQDNNESSTNMKINNTNDSMVVKKNKCCGCFII